MLHPLGRRGNCCSASASILPTGLRICTHRTCLRMQGRMLLLLLLLLRVDALQGSLGDIPWGILRGLARGGHVLGGACTQPSRRSGCLWHFPDGPNLRRAAAEVGGAAKGPAALIRARAQQVAEVW